MNDFMIQCHGEGLGLFSSRDIEAIELLETQAELFQRDVAEIERYHRTISTVCSATCSEASESGVLPCHTPVRKKPAGALVANLFINLLRQEMHHFSAPPLSNEATSALADVEELNLSKKRLEFINQLSSEDMRDTLRKTVLERIHAGFTEVMNNYFPKLRRFVLPQRIDSTTHYSGASTGNFYEIRKLIEAHPRIRFSQDESVRFHEATEEEIDSTHALFEGELNRNVDGEEKDVTEAQEENRSAYNSPKYEMALDANPRVSMINHFPNFYQTILGMVAARQKTLMQLQRDCQTLACNNTVLETITKYVASDDERAYLEALADAPPVSEITSTTLLDAR